MFFKVVYPGPYATLGERDWSCILFRADGSIEQACFCDAERILKLQHLCYQTEAELYDDYAIPPLTQALRSLLEEYDTQTILVALLGGGAGR